MIKIGNRVISKFNPPFIIAELSGNHNQSIKKAFKIIDAAKSANVDAIKIQTYTADTMTLNVNKKEFKIVDKKNIWKNYSLYSLYKKAHTPWSWHKKIFDYAKKRGIICFSSPFDISAVNFLEKLNVKLYKVASFENTHFPLLKRIANTGKPMIISLGLLKLPEIKEIVKFVKNNGCKKLILLKCTSTYPANPKDLNLKTIDDLRNKFNCEVGFSDHSIGIGAAITSISCGATVIEKHVTLRRKDNDIDSKFSLEPSELKTLKEESVTAWRSIGKINYDYTKNEKRFLKYKRSIYVSKDIKKGEKFSRYNLKIIRPSNGLAPKYINKVIGNKAKTNLKYGTALKSKHF